MWSSFTNDEKRLLVFILAMMGIGAVALPFMKARQSEPVFSAVPAAQHATRATTQTVPTLLPPTFSSSVAPTTAPTAAASAATAAAAGLVDINTASAESLESLPGIGPGKARAIVEYRAQHGAFRSVSDLDGVRGIGPGVLKTIAPLVCVAGAAAAPPPAPALASLPARQTPPAAASNGGGGLVNINTATAGELAALDRIGEKLAQRIVEHRTMYGAFRSPEALMNVKGIGRKIYDDNRHRICVR